MTMINIFTDAGCLGNPGPGAWAAILIESDNRQEFTGFIEDSTSNRLEVTGAIEALRRTPEGCEVRLRTDSRYVSQGMGEWIKNWKSNGWTSSSGKPVKNKDLWLKLSVLAGKRKVTWVWVRRETDPIQHEAHCLAAEKLNRHVKTMVWEAGGR